MKMKPSLDEFRNGGSEGALESSVAVVARAPSSVERANKTIRIRKAFEAKLKEHAYHRSVAEGRRVSESDIIDEALEMYFDK